MEGLIIQAIEIFPEFKNPAWIWSLNSTVKIMTGVSIIQRKKEIWGEFPDIGFSDFFEVTEILYLGNQTHGAPFWEAKGARSCFRE